MHLESKDIKKFEDNTMKTDEMLAFLEHLDNCNFCLEKLVSHEELTSDIHTPAYLKDRILTRAAQTDVRTAKAVRETSQKMQLFYYSLKTAAGVIAALFLLFTMGSIDFSALHTREPLSVEAVIPQTPEKPRRNYLNEFSTQLNRELSKGSAALSSGLDQITNFINGGK